MELPDLGQNMPQLRGKDNNNGLAGKLDFAYDEDTVDGMTMDSSPIGDILHFDSGDIWHFSEWDHIMSFMESKFGAMKTAWNSDEYEGDQPRLEDCEEIVASLVGQGEGLLILLKGIHPDLDELISYRLSHPGKEKKNARTKRHH